MHDRRYASHDPLRGQPLTAINRRLLRGVTRRIDLIKVSVHLARVLHPEVGPRLCRQMGIEDLDLPVLHHCRVALVERIVQLMSERRRNGQVNSIPARPLPWLRVLYPVLVDGGQQLDSPVQVSHIHRTVLVQEEILLLCVLVSRLWVRVHSL